MGTALVIPTNEVKMLIPKTAANLQRALRKPNAVVLRRERERTGEESVRKKSSFLISQNLIIIHISFFVKAAGTPCNQKVELCHVK